MYTSGFLKQSQGNFKLYNKNFYSTTAFGDQRTVG